MSFVIAAPDLVAMATEDLAGIGASLTAANAAAAVPTSGLLAAAGDEVSAAIAALFSSHGQQYQAMSAQAAAFHARFVQALAGAMGAYAAAEAANASPLQTLEQGLLGAINAPAAALSGRPFIGNGTNGAPGTGEAGGPGGWLLGNGGNGGSGAPGQTGGAGGAAGLLGHGGTGGAGGTGASGGKGGTGGWLWGSGGAGGAGGSGGGSGGGGWQRADVRHWRQRRRSNSRLPTTLNARDQPPAEVSDQRVSGLTGAVHDGVVSWAGARQHRRPGSALISRDQECDFRRRRRPACQLIRLPAPGRDSQGKGHQSQPLPSQRGRQIYVAGQRVFLFAQRISRCLSMGSVRGSRADHAYPIGPMEPVS